MPRCAHKGNLSQCQQVGPLLTGCCVHQEGQTLELVDVKGCYLHPTVEVRCSSTAPAMAAPSEVDVPRPSSSNATCVCV